MTVQECYEKMGSDYATAIGRMQSDDMIKKFLKFFLMDTNFEKLEQDMQEENYDEAFRMAHTLKGVCQNLALNSIFEPAEELTECLRESKRDIPRAKELFAKLKECNDLSIGLIKEIVEE